MLLSSVELVLVSIDATPSSSAQTVPTPLKLNKAIALIPKKQFTGNYNTKRCIERLTLIKT